MLKYLEDFSDVDLSIYCTDDPQHNARVKAAKALLVLIEMEIAESNQPELKNSFSEKLGTRYTKREL